MSKSNNKIKLDKNQPVYLGIDVHRNKYSTTFIHCGEIAGKFTIKGEFEELKKLLKKYKEMEIRSVYEAGFSGFYLHYKLKEMGIKNIVTPPNKIPILTGDKVKTDKRDSLKLATFLSRGLLKAINIPSKEQINLRQILRTRERMLRKKKRVINQLKMLIIQYGITYDVVGIPKYLRQELRQLNLPSMVQLSVNTFLDEIEFHEIKINEFNKIYKKGPEKEEYKKNYELLLSIGGIGELTATALTYEIGDWNRFNNEKEISAYFGLTPTEFSSGEYVHKGRITGQGNSWLRGLLIEAAWKNIEKDENMRHLYENLKAKKGGKKAIVAISRKLVCKMFAMIKKQEKYNYKKAA